MSLFCAHAKPPHAKSIQYETVSLKTKQQIIRLFVKTHNCF